MLYIADATTKPMGIAGLVARLRSADGVTGSDGPMVSFTWIANGTSNHTVRPTGPPGAPTG